MRSHARRLHRPGAVFLEKAILLPAFLLVWVGIFIAGLGIFRYVQLSALAREAARYAVVRGSQYSSETGKTAVSKSDIKTFVEGKAIGLDTSQLTVDVTWTQSNAPFHVSSSSSPPGERVANKVVVTLSYNWIPELFFGGLTLTSTSEMPMAY